MSNFIMEDKITELNKNGLYLMIKANEIAPSEFRQTLGRYRSQWDEGYSFFHTDEDGAKRIGMKKRTADADIDAELKAMVDDICVRLSIILYKSWLQSITLEQTETIVSCFKQLEDLAGAQYIYICSLKIQVDSIVGTWHRYNDPRE